MAPKLLLLHIHTEAAMANETPDLPPGFRFHPTDEELILYYLKNRAESSPCPVPIIAEVDIYKFDPWVLPEKAMFGDKEWYFFSPRDRKYPNGVRPNRAAGSGYWKATGIDKPITGNGNESPIGVKKALVFYKGKPPKGVKTSWIMHEYRLSESKNKRSMRPVNLGDSSMRLDDWVLCRIYQKNSHQQEESAVTEAESSAQGSNLKMHKSFSLSELLDEADFSLLSRILEAPIDTENPPSGKNPFGYSNLNQTIMTRNPYLEAQPSSFMNENSLKRQRIEEEGDGHYFYPSKRVSNSSWVYSNFGDQFDGQALFNPQMLLNSQFEMQYLN